jgi:hypothetical protein
LDAEAAGQARELDRNAGGLPVPADVLGTPRDPLRCVARHREAAQVALDVGHEDRDAARGELLGHELQRLGLAGTGSSSHQAVTIHHREWNPDLRLLVHGARTVERGAEDDGALGEAVTGCEHVVE